MRRVHQQGQCAQALRNRRKISVVTTLRSNSLLPVTHAQAIRTMGIRYTKHCCVVFETAGHVVN
jgi:hypothetical protein